MRILIAEDDPVSSLILVNNLRKWGHEVVVTKNGLEAYQAMLEDDGPKLAILDWMMPGLTGVDVCRTLRREAATRPMYLILLSALTSEASVVEGLEAGADAYLSKPFAPQDLKARLNIGARSMGLSD
jgi:DNA-binding response OmpR family regulator